jgi:transposase-like protein
MKCLRCGSKQVRRNGHRRGKQNYCCKACGRQFVESDSPRGYSDDVKQICLRIYQSGMGFREIERLTGVGHNTVINWVKQESQLTQAAEPPQQDDADLEQVESALV